MQTRSIRFENADGSYVEVSASFAAGERAEPDSIAITVGPRDGEDGEAVTAPFSARAARDFAALLCGRG